MFNDIITIFNQVEDIWYPTVLSNVELQVASGQSKSKDGNSSTDVALLIINIDNELEKKYLKPVAYVKADDKVGKFTLREDDFFVEGEYIADIVDDTAYERGFFEYMKTNYDNVFCISAVKKFSTIPHFEVGGK